MSRLHTFGYDYNRWSLLVGQYCKLSRKCPVVRSCYFSSIYALLAGTNPGYCERDALINTTQLLLTIINNRTIKIN